MNAYENIGIYVWFCFFLFVSGRRINTDSNELTGLPLWLSWQRIRLQCGRPGFDPCVGKIPWRRERLLTPGFWSGEFHGLYNPWGLKGSDITERLSLSLFHWTNWAKSPSIICSFSKNWNLVDLQFNHFFLDESCPCFKIVFFLMVYFLSFFSLLLLLLLSHFSRVWLCATPQTSAHQAPPSLGFSRQEHWSGLPFPSPMHESEKWKWSRSVVPDSSWPHGLIVAYQAPSSMGFSWRLLEWVAISFFEWDSDK